MTHEKQHLEKCRKDLRYRFESKKTGRREARVKCNICGKTFRYWIDENNQIQCEEVK